MTSLEWSLDGNGLSMQFPLNSLFGLLSLTLVRGGVLFSLSMFSGVYADTSVVDLSKDRYAESKPSVGYELAASVPGMGKYGFVNGSETLTPQWTGSFQVDFQPQFLQHFGVGGFGPNFNLSPPPIMTDDTKYKLVYGFSVGAHARYQFKFWNSQPIVPIVGYSGEYYRYKLRSGGANGFIARGPMAGIWIHLNALDEAAARAAFFDKGLARSYIVLEARRLRGSDGIVSMDSQAYYTGIRLEY